MSSFVVCPLKRMVWTWYHHSRDNGIPTKRDIAIIIRSSGPVTTYERGGGGAKQNNESSVQRVCRVRLFPRVVSMYTYIKYIQHIYMRTNLPL